MFLYTSQLFNVAAPCQVSNSNRTNIGLCGMCYQHSWSAASLTAVEKSRQLCLLLSFLAIETQKSALCNQQSFISLRPLNALQLIWILFRNSFHWTLPFVFKVKLKTPCFGDGIGSNSQREK